MGLRNAGAMAALLACAAGCGSWAPDPDGPPPEPSPVGFTPVTTISAPSGEWHLDPTDEVRPEFYLGALPDAVREAVTYPTTAVYRQVGASDAPATVFFGGVLARRPDAVLDPIREAARPFGVDPEDVEMPPSSGSGLCIDSYTEDPHVSCFWSDGRTLGMLVRVGEPRTDALRPDLPPFYRALTETLP
ncbi:hypothetical protein [Actinocorallia herbida]|nr:hypothetical protein [Actinocorallia herbida]